MKRYIWLFGLLGALPLCAVNIHAQTYGMNLESAEGAIGEMLTGKWDGFDPGPSMVDRRITENENTLRDLRQQVRYLSWLYLTYGVGGIELKHMERILAAFTVVGRSRNGSPDLGCENGQKLINHINHLNRLVNSNLDLGCGWIKKPQNLTAEESKKYDQICYKLLGKGSLNGLFRKSYYGCNLMPVEDIQNAWLFPY